MSTPLLSLLSSSPVTFNSLQKSTGLSATGLALALVDLGGKVAVQDGGLVLAPEPLPQAKEKVPAGPRGPTAKVQPRLEACRSLLLQMAQGESGVTAKDLLASGNGSFVYTDILLVAREELAKGSIQEARKGRKATWVVVA